MILGFEDAFTDIQADYIALCMEYAGQDMDNIYAYIYQTRYERMFNAIFTKDNKTISAGEIGTREQFEEFYNIGIEDIGRLIEVCTKYNHKCPNELKLSFNVKTKQFDAEYGYEDYSINGDTSSDEVFFNWYIEIKNSLNNAE